MFDPIVPCAADCFLAWDSEGKLSCSTIWTAFFNVTMFVFECNQKESLQRSLTAFANVEKRKKREKKSMMGVWKNNNTFTVSRAIIQFIPVSAIRESLMWKQWW
jgi:hypothetical protein